MAKTLIEEAEEKWREEFPNRVNMMKKILSDENDSPTPYTNEELEEPFTELKAAILNALPPVPDKLNNTTEVSNAWAKWLKDAEPVVEAMSRIWSERKLQVEKIMIDKQNQYLKIKNP